MIYCSGEEKDLTSVSAVSVCQYVCVCQRVDVCGCVTNTVRNVEENYSFTMMAVFTRTTETDRGSSMTHRNAFDEARNR